jgi:hypothetical protein
VGNLTVYVPDELERGIRELGVPLAATCRPALEEAVRLRVAAKLATQKEILASITEAVSLLHRAKLTANQNLDLKEAHKIVWSLAGVVEARRLIEHTLVQNEQNRKTVADRLGWSRARLDRVRGGDLRDGELAHLRAVLGSRS